MVNICWSKGLVNNLAWNIKEGYPGVPDGYAEIPVRIWFVGRDKELEVEAEATQAGYMIPLDDVKQELPASIYSIKAIWYENEEPISEAWVKNAFAITDIHEEATYYKEKYPDQDTPAPPPIDVRIHYIDCDEWMDGAEVANPRPGYGVYLCNEWNDFTEQRETDDVWHLGAKWRCLQHQPVIVSGQPVYNEPGWNSPYWKMIEGNNNYMLNLVSTSGSLFYRNEVHTDIIPYLYYGNEDITAKVSEGDFSWTRATEEGQTPADIAWGESHRGMKTLTLSGEDMPDGWSRNNKAFFICTVTIRTNGVVQTLNETFQF